MTRPALVIFILWAAPVHAGVLTSLSAETVDEMESVTLTVRATGDNQVQSVDTSPLEADFEVLNTSTNSQFRSVNGRVESWVEYQFVLRARRTGTLTIPPLSVGSEFSDPMQLSVHALDPEVRDAIDTMVFFETSAEPNRVYVQAQTLLTRRLFYTSGVQIYSDLPGAPEIADAVVIPLGTTTPSTTSRDGRTYGVVEQRFAIFPERSGVLTIPEISVTSSIRMRTRGRIRRSGVRVRSERLDIEVMPIPDVYPPNQPWLPASDVQLTETWSPTPVEFSVGDPINRILTVNARGNTGSIIPRFTALVPDSHFRQYPEPEQQDDDASGHTVLGTRIQGYSLVPTRPGPLQLPGVAITWWDTDDDQLRQASVAERTVHVTGEPVVDEQPPLEPTPPSTPAVERESAFQSWWIALLVSGFLAGWAVTLIWSRYRRRAPPPPDTEHRERSAQQNPHTQLKAACGSGDLARIRRALVEYLADYWKVPITDVPARLQDEGSDLLERLNEALYSDDGRGSLSDLDVMAQVRSLSARSAARRPSPLPELYPEH
ncbi:MAG: BatD family protein [Pseudomonadales bacterium]|nr:BatD family protein [Pseudomonadales bacterium]MDP6471331.1 BatD family protein [Pseudomonadales bacterium]MDP6826478.1 BatD family protein [Pseudomonadales bacterium]MDP6970067.1 BatD family protein [Pseudomonadales bacterium]